MCVVTSTLVSLGSKKSLSLGLSWPFKRGNQTRQYYYCLIWGSALQGKEYPDNMLGTVLSYFFSNIPNLFILFLRCQENGERGLLLRSSGGVVLVQGFEQRMSGQSPQ